MKLVIFSICKDEASTIGKLLDAVPKKIAGISRIETLVISDGSTDDTAKVARAHGAKVIDGRSQKRLATRFEQAMDTVLAMGADIAVNIDGDLQFSPADIPKLVAPIVSGEADFVAADRFTDPQTGQRRKPQHMPGGKYFANRIGSWTVGALSGRAFRDVTCGFRAYNRLAMTGLNINSNYTYTQESFQLMALKRMKIVSIPVPVTYYPGRKSRVVTSFWQFLFGSGLNIMRAFRDFAPLRFFFLLGLPATVLGSLALLYTAIHYYIHGRFSPFKFVGIIGLYLFTLGILIWIVAIFADMLNRSLKNQEKILTRLKQLQYDQDDDKKV